MKHPLRNTVLYVAGSIVVAALLGAPFSARADGLGEPCLHAGAKARLLLDADARRYTLLLELPAAK